MAKVLSVCLCSIKLRGTEGQTHKIFSLLLLAASHTHPLQEWETVLRLPAANFAFWHEYAWTHLSKNHSPFPTSLLSLISLCLFLSFVILYSLHLNFFLRMEPGPSRWQAISTASLQPDTRKFSARIISRRSNTFYVKFCLRSNSTTLWQWRYVPNFEVMPDSLGVNCHNNNNNNNKLSWDYLIIEKDCFFKPVRVEQTRKLHSVA